MSGLFGDALQHEFPICIQIKKYKIFVRLNQIKYCYYFYFERKN